jgi:hypothetical protein
MSQYLLGPFSYEWPSFFPQISKELSTFQPQTETISKNKTIQEHKQVIVKCNSAQSRRECNQERIVV